MCKKIMNIFRKLKIKHLKWMNIGKFHIEKGFSFIGTENISLGNYFYAESNLRLQAWKSYKSQVFTPLIKIGNNVSMMENCQISCCSKVMIGDGCLFGANVFITDNFHGNNTLEQNEIAPVDRPLYVKGDVYIGNNVWIGRNVCIMPGVSIGDGAVIGANSIVTHSIPEKGIAAGMPAKVIKLID